MVLFLRCKYFSRTLLILQYEAIIDEALFFPYLPINRGGGVSLWLDWSGKSPRQLNNSLSEILSFKQM